MSTPSWNDILAETESLEERIEDAKTLYHQDRELIFAEVQARATVNQTRALARLGEELSRISFRTIATTDYS